MLAAWPGRRDVELLAEDTAVNTSQNMARVLPLLLARRRRGGDDRVRAGPPPALPLLLRRRLSALRRAHAPIVPPACARAPARSHGRRPRSPSCHGRGETRSRSWNAGGIRSGPPRESRYWKRAPPRSLPRPLLPDGRARRCLWRRQLLRLLVGRVCCSGRAERRGSRSRCLRGRQRGREWPFRARRDRERKWPRRCDDRRRPGQASSGRRRELGRARDGREARFLRTVLCRRRPGEPPGALHPLPEPLVRRRGSEASGAERAGARPLRAGLRDARGPPRAFRRHLYRAPCWPGRSSTASRPGSSAVR